MPEYSTVGVSLSVRSWVLDLCHNAKEVHNPTTARALGAMGTQTFQNSALRERPSPFATTNQCSQLHLRFAIPGIRLRHDLNVDALCLALAAHFPQKFVERDLSGIILHDGERSLERGRTIMVTFSPCHDHLLVSVLTFPS